VTDIETRDLAWSPAFRAYSRRFLPFGAAFGFVSGVFGSDRFLSFGTLVMALLSACAYIALLAGSIAVYTSLRRWRTLGAVNHYVTWILCVAAAAIPLAIAVRLLLKGSLPGTTELDVGGGPFFALAIILFGCVLGIIAQSLEGTIRRAEEEIAARRRGQK